MSVPVPPLSVSAEWIEDTRASMPELPRAMAARFVAQYGLPEYDATTLTQSQAMAAYFEDTAKACGQPKLASNWVMGEISRRLNNEEIGMDAVKVSSAQLAALIGRITDNTISNNAAKQVFEALWVGEGSEVDAVIAANVPWGEMPKALQAVRAFAELPEAPAPAQEALHLRPRHGGVVEAHQSYLPSTVQTPSSQTRSHAAWASSTI